MTDNQSCQQDEHITSIADAVIKLKELRESNKNLNEPDIEEQFARLALAFKTDKFTLGQRLDLQHRQRDVAEKNVENELKALRESLNALNQLCAESDMRDIITKTQQHVDIVQQATMRMSSRAETYGAIQQEQRMNCAFETMLNYMEHLKLLYDKEHIELEEYRRLLAEHNLLPEEKGMCDLDDPKRILPPRSHSLSSSTKPENRTRLLSAVCLLNNNYETPRSTPSSSGSASPKSRRSSLPVGPSSLCSQATNSSPRAYANINEQVEHRENLDKVDHHSLNPDCTSGIQDSELSKQENSTPKENPPDKDSSELIAPIPPLSIPSPVASFCPQQELACDTEAEDVCLFAVPDKPKSLYLLKFLNWTSEQRIWKWDNGILFQQARYTLSAMLATAAMLTLILTFVPNRVLA